MDTNRLRTGELIAGVAGIALLLIMFIFNWYGLSDVPDEFEGGLNAWEAYGFIDIILFITIVVAVGLAAATAMAQTVSLPVAAGALTAGLGILSTLLILFRIIASPEYGAFGVDVETDVKIGAFLGLIAAAAIAYGGWRSMQEEGTTFSAQADRLQDRVGDDDRTGDREPPPPPPPPPPAGGTGTGAPPGGPTV
jgi:hypothetical protein